jgi:hypothetical protein
MARATPLPPSAESVGTNLGPFVTAIEAGNWRGLQQTGNGTSGDSSGSQRPCGSVIDIIPVASVVELATSFAEGILMRANLTSFLPTVLQLLVPAIKYDLQVVKVCGQCSDVILNSPEGSGTDYFSLTGTDQGDTDIGTFDSYCSPPAYGVADNITQSGIALIPVQNVTNMTGDNQDRMLLFGTLRPLVFMHETIATVTKAPSVSWPDDFATELTSFNGNATLIIGRFFTFLTGIIGASTGAVTGVYGISVQNDCVHWYL